MTISIGSNIQSLIAQRQLGASTDRLSRINERLASGQRINRASDDAAGLAISSTLNSNARVYSQAIRNINDGISALAIAEGALDGLTGITIRIRELATQAANGSFSRIQRGSLDEEADALVNEFNRILVTTRFNGTGLLDRTIDSLRLQAGFGLDGSIEFRVGSSLGRTVGTGQFTNDGGTSISGASSVLADLNRDGILDYISASTLGSNIVYAFGNGDGTFGGANTLAVTGTNSSLAVGDFNGDGTLDIAVGRAVGSQLDIRYQNADGTFQSTVSMAIGTTFTRMTVGDINNDGIDDIVAAGGGLRSFLGGQSGLSAAIVSSTGTSRDAALGDFNNDGFLDAAFTGLNSVELAYGNGRGSFVTQQSWALTNSRGISVGDLNDDGILDVVAGSSTVAAVSVFLGNSQGTLNSATTYASQTGTQDIELGDMNGDGKLDIVAGGALILGNGDGFFQSAIVVNMLVGTPTNISLGDLNGDGVLEIVSSSTTARTVNTSSTTRTNTLQSLTLWSVGQARSVMDVLDATLRRIAQEKGDIGSVQSRLESALKNLHGIRDNSKQAAGRILDADIAAESAQLTRETILQQAGSAILAQANQQPALALTLLGRI